MERIFLSRGSFLIFWLLLCCHFPFDTNQRRELIIQFILSKRLARLVTVKVPCKKAWAGFPPSLTLAAGGNKQGMLSEKSYPFLRRHTS